MADDAAGAVRRTPRPAPAVPELWWSPTIGVWLRTPRGPMLTPGFEMANDPIGGNFRESLPADAVQLVGPDQRRPIVLLRAEDCDCGPPYADCEHGPEPVDALDLAVWLHAESEWWLSQYKHDVVTWRQQVNVAEAREQAAERRETSALDERDGLQARLDAVRLWLDDPQELTPAGQLYQIRAALQGDQPTEPRHELVLKSGLSGCTGACSCGTWHGGGRHEPPSRVAYRWDAEHLTSLPLEQPTGEADRA